MADETFIYGLESRIIDLEKKLDSLEQLVQQQKPTASTIPKEVKRRITNGEHPVRVLREFRLMTQSQLSEKCGIRANHISAIERGQSYGLKTARRFAKALNVPADIFIQ